MVLNVIPVVSVFALDVLLIVSKSLNPILCLKSVFFRLWSWFINS